MRPNRHSSLDLLQFCSVAFCVVALFAVEAAGAEEANSSNTGMQRLLKHTVGCKNSMMTQEKLLDIVHDIAMHGDLTDVEFTENKLQIKLEYVPSFIGPIRNSNPYSRGYKAEYLFKTCLNVGYGVSFNPREFKNGKRPAVNKEGFLDFHCLNKPDIDFHNCGSLFKEQINRKFGGNFTENIDKIAKNAGACKELVGVGSIPITIIYNFDADNNAVNSISIYQHLPGAGSFKCNRSAP
jgi:hypothetical protein